MVGTLAQTAFGNGSLFSTDHYYYAARNCSSANGIFRTRCAAVREELQGLVAPIALYPDSLVAQILGAASFPDQVARRANWLQQNSNLTGEPLMHAVDAQPWDPSVKAITQFPSVLDNMAKNLSWTSALGEAYSTRRALTSCRLFKCCVRKRKLRAI